MEFVDPIVVLDEVPETTEVGDTKTDHAVQALESEIEKAYAAVETRFGSLWSNATKNANEIQEKYQVEEHRKQLLDQLKVAKDNINNKAKVTETLAQFEDHFKKVPIPEVDLKKLQLQANDALDVIDSKLEIVEQQAGKYVSQMSSFFTNFVSIAAPQSDAKQLEDETSTIFVAPSHPTSEYGTSRYDNELFKLHTSAEYYTEPIQDDKADTFNADSKTKEVAKLLETYPNTLTKLMNDIVPVKVPYNTFWYRYFHHEAELKQAEKRRRELQKEKGDEDEEDDFTWDDDEEEVETSPEKKEKPVKQETKPESDDEWE